MINAIEIAGDDEVEKGDPAVRRCAAHDECRPGWRCVGVKVGKCKQVDP